MRSFAVLLLLFILSAHICAQNPPIHFREVGMQSGLTTVPFSSMKQHYVVETISGGIALFDCDNEIGRASCRKECRSLCDWSADVCSSDLVGMQSGLTTVPFSSMKQHYVVETISGGIALFDCDNGGKLDIAVVNDSTIEQAQHGGVPMITLYHQGENLKFTDVTKSAGLTHKGWGMGIAVADYDNEGLPDIYVTGYGGNVLYHNLGNCKFEDVTAKAGVAGGGFSAGAGWADYDRDGHLDLFVSRYVHTDLNHLPTAENPSKNFFHKGLPVE